MQPKPLLGETQIRDEVRRLAARISADHAGATPLLVGILKGAFVFLADLVRELTVPVHVDFMQAASYGDGMESSGRVEVVKDLDSDPRGRHVIVVEDIADTGRTMEAVVDRIRARGPASIKRCALLVRKGCPKPEYTGFEIGPGFVVGYGIDYAQDHRGRRDIAVLPKPAE